MQAKKLILTIVCSSILSSCSYIKDFLSSFVNQNIISNSNSSESLSSDKSSGSEPSFFNSSESSSSSSSSISSIKSEHTSSTSNSINSQESSSSNVSSDAISSESSSFISSSSNVASSSINSTSSSISSEKSSSSSSASSIEVPLKTFTLNSSNYDDIGSYSTNFEDTYVNGFNFFHYRAFDPNDSAFLTLVPYTSYCDDGSHEGALFNTSAIEGIRKIEITYQTTENINNPRLYIGNHINPTDYVELEASTSKVTKTYNIDDYDYFKLDTNNNQTKIYSITIGYTNIKDNDGYYLNGSGDNDYRLNPVTVNETLVPGKSKVTVPIEVKYTESGYDVLKTKTYTYYTYDYIKSNPNLADEAALIDPVDIAAYYNSFKTHPANYVVKKNYNTCKQLFGNKARCISTYSRTDGYATSVPWQKQPSKNTPLYHELDIDVENGYSSSSRGVGRLVVWQYGFTSKGYDSSPVCTFTSDHYKTFHEYMNDGTFGQKFNVEGNVVNYEFSPAVTKN